MFQQVKNLKKQQLEWLALATDEGATYDTVVELDTSEIEPFVTWGTNPSMGSGITNNVPYSSDFESESDKEALKNALEYMGLEEGMPLHQSTFNMFLLVHVRMHG